MGLGLPEALIILIIGLVLFGPTLIAFWLGFTLGKKRGKDETAVPISKAPSQPVDTNGPIDE